MSEAIPNEDEIKRKILFTPLKTKEDLHAWIQVFLKLDWPDGKVDEDSTASPMDAIWQIYEASLSVAEPQTFLNYAARDSYKTLGAAVLEVLALVHMNRSVAHMAAIEGQAAKAQSYVKKFLRMPYLRDYVVGNNERKVEFVRYQNKTSGINLTKKEWQALLTNQERDQYDEISNYITIVVCTMAGANSEHVPFMVVDELDVVPNLKAYEESKMIPAPAHDGRPPITLLTSTRKTNRGPVQDEVDNAEDRGTVVTHWNLIDVTKACPVERHRPDLPRLPIYINDKTIEAISEEKYDDLTHEKQEDFVREEGYTGCLKNCKIFAACKGRLATEQTSKSPLLRDVTHTQAQFRKVTAESAIAQLLCRKPSSEGLVYSRLDPEIHMLSAAEIAHMVTGENYPERMTKTELIALMHSREAQFFAGMDFGYTHNFAVVQGFRDGSRMFIFDCVSQTQVELPQMFDICENKVLPNRPLVFPDTAYPAYIKEFKRKGYRVRDWDKGKGTVVGGIEVVRLKLRPTGGEPELYFLKDDDGVALLFKRMGQYKWDTDSQGKPTDIPDDTDDDECDAIRYLVMNVFAPKGKITAARTEERNPLAKPQQQQTPQQVMEHHWNQIQNHIGMADATDPATGETVDPTPKSKGKKGGFHWDMG